MNEAEASDPAARSEPAAAASSDVEFVMAGVARCLYGMLENRKAK
jgi:hypothetical protein